MCGLRLVTETTISAATPNGCVCCSAEVKTRVARIDKTERIEKVMKWREEQARKASGKCTKHKQRAGLCEEDASSKASDHTDSIEPQEEAAASGREQRTRPVSTRSSR